jgi:hypothetical protein
LSQQRKNWLTHLLSHRLWVWAQPSVLTSLPEDWDGPSSLMEPRTQFP